VQEVRDDGGRDQEVQALPVQAVHQRGRSPDGVQGLQLVGPPFLDILLARYMVNNRIPGFFY
jgi:hypothetical protein